MNILIAAVGGQGALLAARIIGSYAQLEAQQAMQAWGYAKKPTTKKSE